MFWSKSDEDFVTHFDLIDDEWVKRLWDDCRHSISQVSIIQFLWEEAEEWLSVSWVLVRFTVADTESELREAVYQC